MLFRSREFEQAEMEYFVHPSERDKWFRYWLDERLAFHRDLGFEAENLRTRSHEPDELAHYAKAAFDIEYEFPFGWQEFEGIHNRTDFDLSRHQEYSGKKLEYVDTASGERFVPYIIETSLGVDRLALVVLADAYREEEVKGEKRVVLGLHPSLAQIGRAHV